MKDPVQERIEREINEHDVVVFIKGTPVFPQCGFSSVVVQVLSHLGVKFKGVDVLSDPALRQGIKAFSDWPTVPATLCQRRVCGRLRYRSRDVRHRRTRAIADGPRGEDRRRPDLMTVTPRPGASQGVTITLTV